MGNNKLHLYVIRDINENNNNYTDYTCFDKKIHVRLRDFNHKCSIYGFENKLAYLLTYLIHTDYAIPLDDYEHLNKVLKNFGTTDQVMEIVSVIANRTLNTKVKGIKILKNYNRQKTCKPFGDVVLEAFPDTTDIIGKNALNTFLKKLNVTLEEYLYNDGIYLILTDKNKVKNTNQKFNNKAKQRYNSCDLEVLW